MVNIGFMAEAYQIYIISLSILLILPRKFVNLSISNTYITKGT